MSQGSSFSTKEQKEGLRSVELALVLDQLGHGDEADALLRSAESAGLVGEAQGRRDFGAAYWERDHAVESLDDPVPNVGLSLIEEIPGGPVDPGATKDLRLAVARWRRLRLWDGNLVPELVVHDDRHSAEVDRFATLLAMPFLVGPVPLLSVSDVAVLTAASWLHDWGHVGGVIRRSLTEEGRPVAVGEPQDVRALHGLVTQELLEDEWAAMHGLSEEVAPWAALLAGHHQSWTSFGDDEPEYASVAGIDVRPLTFEEDYERLAEGSAAESPPYAVAQHLLALLRIADALDVGIHRVPDYGPHKETFLARSIQTHAYRALARAQLTRSGDPGLSRFEGVVEAVSLNAREWAARSLIDPEWKAWKKQRNEMQALLRDKSIDSIEERHSLVKYLTYVGTGQEHYELHNAVRSVRLRFTHERRAPHHRDGVVVDVLVGLTEASERLAVKVLGKLRESLEKELRGGSKESTVGSVLLSVGLRLGEVVDYTGGVRGTSMKIDHEW